MKMRIDGFLLSLSAAAVFCACGRGGGVISLSKVSEIDRPSVEVAAQISGVTWAGGDLYYAVDDSDNKIYPLTLAISRKDGSLAATDVTIGPGVTVFGADDMEGCAFDAASGKVWVSDEGTFKTRAIVANIREIDPATGRESREVAIPAPLLDYRPNFSFEALTISPDGREMWTCNEEALECDGDNSTEFSGSTVRLTKFTRETPGGEWKLAGEWAYVTEPVGSPPLVWRNDTKSRSGVVGLCALPNGKLLVLERNFHGKSLFAAKFHTSIFEVDFEGATDVSSIAALKGGRFEAVGKERRFGMSVARVNYEGICLGPQLNDGSYVLVLVSDGGSCLKKIMTLKLKF